jgi:hypothetical protein
MLLAFSLFAEGLTGGGVSDDRYPILSDPSFLTALHTEVLKSDGWVTPELCKAVQFAWGVLLREYASRPAFTGEAIFLLVISLEYPIVRLGMKLFS